MEWWQAPEWADSRPMHYPKPSTGPMKRMPRHVEYDEKEKKWVSFPVRVFRIRCVA